MDDNQRDQILMDIKASASRQEALLESHIEVFNKHVADDAALTITVNNLKSAYDRQSGAGKVWSMIGTGIGTAIGLLIAFFTGIHH